MVVVLWYFYSAIFWFLARLVQLVAVFRPSLAVQLEGRWWQAATWLEIQQWCRKYQRRVVVFCSSAGEYEQAKPLIARLESKLDCGVMVLIFSQSGIQFARAQGDDAMIRKASWDLLWIWQRFFHLVQPQLTLIVRHEIWPGFVRAAYRQGTRLFLIDAVAGSQTSSGLKRLWKTYLYRFFQKICVVSIADVERLREDYGCSAEQLLLTGDTKYDRVVERLEERQQRWLRLQKRVDAKWQRRRRLIVGSAWPADVSLVAKVFQQDPLLRQKWQVVLAPHDISPAMIECLVAECQTFGLSCSLWSELEQSRNAATSHEVLVVDAMGILAEFYGCADLAFVGGGMHHRVHNVLEPSCRGLPVSFGPRHHTSQEANWLVSRNLVTVVTNEAELNKWWNYWHQQDDLVDHRLLAEVKALCGASDRILRMFAIVLEE